MRVVISLFGERRLSGSARVARVGFSVPLKQSSLRTTIAERFERTIKVRDCEMQSPARETRATQQHRIGAVPLRKESFRRQQWLRFTDARHAMFPSLVAAQNFDFYP